jgi:hypothetical protein
MNASKHDWSLVVVVALGTAYGVEKTTEVIARALFMKGLAALSLIYLLTPFLLSRRRWLFRVAYAFCIFEVLASGLMLLSSFVSAINPISFTIRLFTVKTLYLDTLGSQFLYFAGRAALFLTALVLLAGTKKKEPNKAPEPTTGAVTPRATEGTSK